MPCSRAATGAPKATAKSRKTKRTKMRPRGTWRNCGRRQRPSDKRKKKSDWQRSLVRRTPPRRTTPRQAQWKTQGRKLRLGRQVRTVLPKSLLRLEENVRFGQTHSILYRRDGPDSLTGPVPHRASHLIRQPSGATPPNCPQTAYGLADSGPLSRPRSLLSLAPFMVTNLHWNGELKYSITRRDGFCINGVDPRLTQIRASFLALDAHSFMLQRFHQVHSCCKLTDCSLTRTESHGTGIHGLEPQNFSTYGRMSSS